MLTNVEFANIEIQCDIIFSIAVADIIPLESFKHIIEDSYLKLKKDAYFVIVVPRNDTSILRRCNNENAYNEGFIFKKGKYTTYMRNYRDPNPLYNEFEKNGFSLVEDLSVFNQICSIFKKN